MARMATCFYRGQANRRRLTMAKAGQEVYSPRQNDRIIFKQTASMLIVV